MESRGRRGRKRGQGYMGLYANAKAKLKGMGWRAGGQEAGKKNMGVYCIHQC